MFALTFVLIIVGLQIFSEFSDQKQTVKTNIAYVGNSYLKTLSNHAYDMDYENLQLAVEGIVRLEGIEYAKVLEPFKDQVESLAEAGKQNTPWEIETKFTIPYAGAAEGAPQYAVLIVYGSYSEIYDILKRKAISFILVGLTLSFVFAFGLFFIFSRVVNRHVLDIAGFFNELDFNNLLNAKILKLDRKSAAGKGDEFDTLVTSINRMKNRIETGMANQQNVQQQLRDLLSEKEILLQEIHHRVKNNLNVIVSLLNLQKGQVHTKDEALRAIDETSKRIFTIALVHESVYQSKDPSSVEMDDYIRNLASHFLSTMGEEKRVSFQFDLENISMDITKAIPCGIVINELVTNAYRHAFTEQSEGVISFSLKNSPNNEIALCVSDNGKGLPRGFSLEQSSSLGFTLIKSLCVQVEGLITFTTNGTTTFTLTMPLKQQKNPLRES